MSVIANWVFQSASTATGNGYEYIVSNVGANTTMAISISGTATARTVVFEGKGLVGDYVAIKCYNSTTGTLASQTTGTTDEIWIADLTGLSKFRCHISSIADNSLSISGKVVE
ncbi:MAG: hypothetical protein PHT02_00200 [Tissierellia bacterium]|nr:hypothetical protein [Tissierellia bacterium]